MVSRSNRDKRSFFAGSDRIMNSAVFLLLLFGVILVYAATRDWFASNQLDPEYYLKRQIINVIIGIALAYGTTLIDYRLLRAYTPIVWGVGVVGLIAVLIPGLGSTVNGARSWVSFPDRKSTRLNSSHRT